MHSTEETIGGHPADVFVPTEMNKHGYVLLYLHGVHLNRIVDKPVFVELFEKHGLPVVAPFTKRSWWTDKVCAEFDPKLTAEKHVLQNVMPYIAERFDARPPQIGLFGTSMGGQGALRLAYKHPNTFPIVAAISPAIDFHKRYHEGDETIPLMYPNQEAARQDTAILHVRPLYWPRNQFFCCDPIDERWWDSCDRLKMKLGSSGVPYVCDLQTTGGGHGFDYYNRMASKTMDFLVERLDAERRRVP